MVDTSEYAASFALVDADGDGFISAAELKNMMHALGEEMSDERAHEVVRKVDSDGDERISLEEFAVFMSRGSSS